MLDYVYVKSHPIYLILPIESKEKFRKVCSSTDSIVYQDETNYVYTTSKYSNPA